VTRIAQTYPQLAQQLSVEPWSSREFALARAAWELAAGLFAGAERGSGKAFVDHLIGTASAVSIGGGNADTVAAALVHAAYDQGDFGDGHRGASASHRRSVRAALGADVEELVHGYDAVEWDERLVDPCRVLRDISPELLLVRVANELDDALDGASILSAKVRSAQIYEATIEVAERVASPELVAMLRDAFLATHPPIAPELVIGAVGSRGRMPASARLSLRARATPQMARVTRSLRRRVGRETTYPREQ